MIIVEMNHRFYLVAVIDQGNMIADGDIAMISGRRRKLPGQLGRRRVYSAPQVPVERAALMQARLLLG